MIEFEFDREKSLTNRMKHGIDFSDAQQLWQDYFVVVPTYAGSDGERTCTIGMINDVCWVAVTTKRHGRIRIISVRRARKIERKKYYEYRNSNYLR